MKILKPNVNEALIQIPKHAVYISIADYGAMFLLKEIVIRPGHHTWFWIPLNPKSEINLSELGDQLYISFDKAINRKVNDSYSTVYSFENMNEVISEWKNIKYVDQIQTIYKASNE